MDVNRPLRGPVVIRRRLGGQLRELREARVLRLEDVAKALECSTSKISRLENGQGIPKTRDVRDLMNLYEVEDERLRERLTRWTAEAKAQGWWHAYSDAVPRNLEFFISLEAESATVRTFTPFVIYGLFQTTKYARAVLRDTVPGCSAEQIERLAELRRDRQAVLARAEQPLTVTAVIDEAALWRVMGDRTVMADQLRHLVDLSTENNVEILVFPFEAGADEAISTFCIFGPRDPRDHVIVNMENTGHDAYIEEESEVLNFVNIFDDLTRRSLSSAESRVRITSAIKAHEQRA